jgi:hypothetical protein
VRGSRNGPLDVPDAGPGTSRHSKSASRMKYAIPLLLLVATCARGFVVPFSDSLNAAVDSISDFLDYFTDIDVESAKKDPKAKKPKKEPKNGKKPKGKEPKKGKGGKGKVDPACKPVIFDDRLPKDAEPSGCAYDDSRNVIWTISDNGYLMKTDLNGTQVTKYELGEKLDIEDLVFVPSRPNYLYLALEAPASVLEYDLNSQKISRRWALFDNNGDQNRGIEALGLLPSPLSRYGYFFIAGSQADAQLHVFEINLEAANGKALPMAIVKPPGPGEDLSAMSTSSDGQVLFLLFDKHQQLLGINATRAPKFLPDVHDKPEGWFPQPTPVFDLSKAGSFHFDLPMSGAEGVTFTPDYMFIGIDASKNRGERKGLERWGWPRQVTHCMKHKSHEKLVIQQ